jgi:hypothetical protein
MEMDASGGLFLIEGYGGSQGATSSERASDLRLKDPPRVPRRAAS